MKKTIRFAAFLLLLALLFSSCGASIPAETEPGTETARQTEAGETAGKQTPPATETKETKPQKTEAPLSNPSAIGADSLNDDTLPAVYLTVPDGNALLWNKDDHAMTVTVKDSLFGDGDFDGAAGVIRCRGNATFSAMPKKSFRIKFDEAKNLFGQDTAKAKRWTLLAEYGDRSFLRNHAAMAMAEILGLVHSSSSFVRLYLNGSYQGVYHLMEQAECKKSRVPLSPTEGASQTDALVELDGYANRDGVKNFDYFSLSGKMYSIKDPDPTYELCAYLKSRFTKAENALRTGNREAVEAVIDVPSFVNMYLLQAFSKNMDSGWSSFYYSVPENGKIACVWPWDFDIAFGADERLDNGSPEGLYTGDWHYSRLDQYNTWFGYLMAKSWFVDLVRDRWSEVAEDAYRFAEEEIMRIDRCFGDEMDENFRLWNSFGYKLNVEPEAVIRLSNREEHVDQLMNWLDDRYQWLDAYFENPDTAYRTVVD